MISSELSDIHDWNSVANDNNVENYYMESTNNANHMAYSCSSPADCFCPGIFDYSEISMLKTQTSSTIQRIKSL